MPLRQSRAGRGAAGIFAIARLSSPDVGGSISRPLGRFGGDPFRWEIPPPMLRKISIGSILLLVAVLSSCGAMRRFGKDVSLAVLSPAVILYAAGTDAYESGQSYAEGAESGGATQVLWMVPSYFYHGVKHTAYAFVHALDALLLPVYGLADLHPSVDVQPLQIYTGTIFDETEGESGTDPESGEDDR